MAIIDVISSFFFFGFNYVDLFRPQKHTLTNFNVKLLINQIMDIF